jgi:OFA family oxalate/formate antiporter-like MFS transporter
LVGFSFGGNLVIYAAQVAATFGIAAVGTVYPLVFQSYGLSGITGPIMGGWIFDRTGSYTLSILVAATIAGLGVIGTAILRERREVSL